MTNDPLTRPSRLLWRAEGARALIELAQFWAAFPLLAHALPRGDGHTVLTIPGFVADDSSMRPLRTLLSRRGYWAQPWSLGRNLGPTRQVLDGMSKRLTELYAGSGRPVSLIGQSLGGVYARDLARRHPDMVRGVITLGSPFRLDRREHNSHRTNTGDLFAATRGSHSPEFAQRAPESQLPPLPVPATAIYSRTDGVVPWRSCLEHDGPLSESLEVVSSHCGLGVHLGAVAIILDRVAQPEGRWQPFHRLTTRAA